MTMLFPRKINEWINASKWIIRGKPLPTPHIVKQRCIKGYRGKHHVLIETGTYRGDMVEAMKKTFKKIYSIEIDSTLFTDAKRRFQNDPSVEIWNGDSGELLKTILTNVTEPAVFWLDGHYSGGVTSKGNANTPIYRELEAIFNHPIKNHVVLVDDAHLFIGKDDYPTISEIKGFIKMIDPNLNLEIGDDIMRITNLS